MLEKCWIDAKETPPARDRPIIIAFEYREMPCVVQWQDINKYYDEPVFLEGNGEYTYAEERITHWMYAPEMP